MCGMEYGLWNNVATPVQMTGGGIEVGAHHQVDTIASDVCGGEDSCGSKGVGLGSFTFHECWTVLAIA